MAQVKGILCLFLITIVMTMLRESDARPYNHILSRQKRVSDQRLAELETLIALSKMKGKLVTVPVGFGRIDPAKLGRRRRSVAKLIRSLMEPQEDSAIELNSYESDEDGTGEDDRDEHNILLDLLLNEKIRHHYRTFDLPD